MQRLNKDQSVFKLKLTQLTWCYRSLSISLGIIFTACSQQSPKLSSAVDSSPKNAPQAISKVTWSLAPVFQKQITEGITGITNDGNFLINKQGLYSLKTQKLQPSVLTRAYESALFSPWSCPCDMSSDNRYFVTSSGRIDRLGIKIFDLKSNSEYEFKDIYADGLVFAGNQLLVIQGINTVLVDIDSGKILKKIRSKIHRDYTYGRPIATASSRASIFAVLGFGDKTVGIQDWNKSISLIIKPKEKFANDFSPFIRTIAVSPNGKLVAYGMDGGGIGLLNTDSGKYTDFGGKRFVPSKTTALSFSPDSTILAVGGGLGMFSFHDVSEALNFKRSLVNKVKSFYFPRLLEMKFQGRSVGWNESISDIRFSSDMKRLIVTNSGDEIVVYDISKNR